MKTKQELLVKYPICKVIFFELQDGFYRTSNGEVVTTEMLMSYPHAINGDKGYLIIEEEK